MTHKRGFTLIEILVVIAIVSLLAIAAIMGYLAQLPKARDAERKADIERIKIAFEDYYNDNECYPPPDILNNCASDDLAPYITGGIPCDPQKNTPYCYVYDTTSPCQNYRILTSLENRNDQIIRGQNCDPVIGCNFDLYCGGNAYNYITASSNVSDPTDTTGIIFPIPTPTPTATPEPSASPATSPTTTPTPTPTPDSGPYACQNNVCNNYGFPNNCPISFSSRAACESYCPTADPASNCN